MAYTTINKSTAHFNTKLYTGNGGTQNITGVGFKPDWVWIKSRSLTKNHKESDVVRAATKAIQPNGNDQEATDSNGITSFNSDGFSLGAGGDYNTNNATQVSWNWKAGTSFSNSAGANGASIASTGSVNTTAGFSIIKWTGSGANATIAHGLGVVPKMILFKNLSSAVDWRVYNYAIGNTHRLCLNDTSVKVNDDSAFNDTSPTSTVFSVGGSSSTNAGTMIAYCFSDKTGYSKIGSYTGIDSNDNTFIYTGFKPKYILTKEYDASDNGWLIYDTTRNPNNPMDGTELFANTNGVESDSNAYVDFLSNGFKIRSASGKNGDGTYIYMAFGQSLVGTNNVPCTAR